MSMQLSIAEAALQLLLTMPSVEEAQQFASLCIPGLEEGEVNALWHRRVSVFFSEDGNHLMLECAEEWLEVTPTLEMLP